MSFSVLLSQDVVPVEAGTTTPLSISITNRGAESDRFEIEIEGIDTVWKAIPVPEIEVQPGETAEEKAFFKPPRESESLAGHYPFVVRVRSLGTGETRQAQGILEIKPFHTLSMEVNPRKGYVSPTTKRNVFELSVMNLGNTPHTVQLVGSDPEDACAYEFSDERIQLGPGQTKTVSVEVKPRKTNVIAQSRLIGFSVTARSVEHGSVSAVTQGQLEQRSLLTPGSLAAIVIAALLAFLWFINMPKPPAVGLRADLLQVTRGDEVKLSWESSERSRVNLILEDGTVLLENGNPEGVFTFKVEQKDSVTIFAQAKRDNMTTKSDPVTIKIAEPEVVPEPEILSLKASATRVRVGSSFFLNYKFSSAVVSATLGPGNKDIDTTLSRVEVAIPTDTVPGPYTYEISAKNKLGIATVKSIQIQVYDESEAQILEFTANKTRVEPFDNAVSISWQVTRAARVELKSSSGEQFEVELKGEREFTINAKTTFTLTAIDDRGRRLPRQVTIEYIDKPDVPPPATDGGSPGVGTTPPGDITTGGTTGPSTAGR